MLLAALELIDFVIIGVIVASFAGGAVALRPNDQARLKRMEAKLDLLLNKLEIEPPNMGSALGLSDEVRKLAEEDGQKIAAIKLHREQTGQGLKEAKEAVEAYIDSLS